MTTTELLLMLNLDPSLKGFRMLADIIALRSADPLCKLGALYAAVAKRYNTTWQCVERNIRHCIFASLNHYGCDDMCEILRQPPSLEGGYTNGRFIALAAQVCAESRR